MCRLRNFKKKLSWSHCRNFVSIIWYQFWNHNFHHVVKKQRNNLAIFGPFLDLQEFFKNRGLSFETSDFNLCGLLNELFHMNIKIKIVKVILKSQMIIKFITLIICGGCTDLGTLTLQWVRLVRDAECSASTR